MENNSRMSDLFALILRASREQRQINLILSRLERVLRTKKQIAQIDKIRYQISLIAKKLDTGANLTNEEVGVAIVKLQAIRDEAIAYGHKEIFENL